MVKTEVVSSYALKCEGVVAGKVAPLENPAQPSVTVYQDGTRAIGCPYLDSNNGMCRVGETIGQDTLKCIQLFPVKNTEIFSSMISFSEVPNEEVMKLESYSEALKYFLAD